MLVYYPASSSLLVRDTVNPAYEELILNFTPNTILYLDPNLGIQAITASHLPISCSWADNAGVALGNFAQYAGSASWASASISSSFSSLAETASFYKEHATFLFTASSYPITVSVALQAISSSIAQTLPENASLPDITATSISQQFGNWNLHSDGVIQGQTLQLGGGTFIAYNDGTATASLVKSNLTGTASWANNVNALNVVGTVTNTTSSSYALFASTFPAVLTSGSSYQITSSYANNTNASNIIGTVTSASYSQFAQSTPSALPSGSTQNITSSWSNNVSAANVIGTVTSASYSTTASFATNAGTSGGTTLTTASTYQVTASWALSASQALSASWAPFVDNPNATSASYATFAQTFPAVLVTASLYQITSSYSQTASVYLGSVTSASFATNTYTSSYILAGNVSGKVSTATTADTASFILASNINGTVANASSASYSVTASAASSITFTPTTASYSVSSSAATSITFVPNSATTSSYLNGLLFDNVSLTTSVTQSNIVVVQRITSSIHAAKYFYNVQSASNNRVGTIFGTWSGSTIGYSDNSDMDLGSTSQVSMSLAVSSSFVQLIAYVSDNSLSWSIYSLGNYI